MEITSALITGNGFVGSAIVRAFADKWPRCSLTILDLHQPAQLPDLPHVAFFQVDITSAAEVSRVLSSVRPEVVVHTAALVPSLADRYGRTLEKQTFHVNVEGTRNVLRAAQEAGCLAFVYTSSCCAVTDDMRFPYANINETWPVSTKSLVYGESKVQAEALVLGASGDRIATCVLRPSVLTGPGDSQLVPSIHACISRCQTLFVVGDGTNLWDVSYVANIADAHVLAAENLISSQTAAGEVFFVQNNEPVSFRDLSLEIWKNFGHTPPFQVRIPQMVAWMMGLAAEVCTWMFGIPLTLSRGSVIDACSTRYASGDKARRVLGYQARIGIEEGIRLSCEDYARHLQERATIVREGGKSHAEVKL